ncbi:Predicted arabinose efflux permease, MFS family [Saccharopolyspora antimicrobica]|uniref:MFS family arabinose efflux permease n=1 Tax=Saccharopolyspora antimicrobica TaxID=455193 RepID=A0A1I5DI99_9PSEU|nr:putative MFS family arabinose efflux permease [Saccharopolyspora antimicrobica]SFN98969.1 Predicted arabinose efflux permease, MFS family [Saccharopolyspora antimicrobica]
MTIRRSSNDRLRFSTLLVLAVGTFAVGADGFILNGLLPEIARDLRVSESVAGQLTTLFAVTYAVGSPVIASVTGSWDRRVLLGGGLAVFTVGMAGQALGTTFAVVAVARVLAALGAAAFQANAYAVAGALAAPEQRGRALATVAAGMTASTVLGVPLGVLGGQWFGWRAVMWAIGVVGVLVAVAIPVLPQVRLPVVGLRDRLAVLVRPAVVKVLLITVVGMFASFTVFAYLPLLLGTAAPGAMLSWVLVAFGVGQVAGNSLAGRGTDGFGPKRVLLLSLAGMALVFALLNWAALTLPTTLLIGFGAGAFSGMLMVPQQHRLFELAADAPTVALGLNGSAIYVGAGLGSAIGGTVLAAAGTPWLAPTAATIALLGLLLAVRTTSSAARTPIPA